MIFSLRRPSAFRPKQPGCSKKFFVLPDDSYFRPFLLKTHHFIIMLTSVHLNMLSLKHTSTLARIKISHHGVQFDILFWFPYKALWGILNMQSQKIIISLSRNISKMSEETLTLSANFWVMRGRQASNILVSQDWNMLTCILAAN